MNKPATTRINFATVFRYLCFISVNLLFISSCITLLPLTVALDQTQKDIDSSTPCLYDSETQSYRECFHITADGSCAHFGIPCNMASITSDDATPCLYDPESQTYKECFHVTADGKCAHFGAPCGKASSSMTSTDATPCLYDAQSNTYKECYHVTADGSCAHFGGACIP